MASDARMKRKKKKKKALQYKDMVIADITALEDELTKDIPQNELDVFFKVIEKMLDNIS